MKRVSRSTYSPVLCVPFAECLIKRQRCCQYREQEDAQHGEGDSKLVHCERESKRLRTNSSGRLASLTFHASFSCAFYTQTRLYLTYGGTTDCCARTRDRPRRGSYVSTSQGGEKEGQLPSTSQPRKSLGCQYELCTQFRGNYCFRGERDR